MTECNFDLICNLSHNRNRLGIGISETVPQQQVIFQEEFSKTKHHTFLNSTSINFFFPSSLMVGYRLACMNHVKD